MNFTDCSEMAEEIYRQQKLRVSAVVTRAQAKAQSKQQQKAEKQGSGIPRCQRSPGGCTAGIQRPPSQSTVSDPKRPTRPKKGDESPVIEEKDGTQTKGDDLSNPFQN